jgi:hypothetical protein
MKSRFIPSLPQVVWTAIFLISSSIACTYRSAGLQPLTTAKLQSETTTQTPTTAQTNNTAAQDKQPCTLTLTGAPTIDGLRLGMTTDEVLAPFAGSKDDPEVRSFLSRPPGVFGVSQLVIRPAKYESPEQPAPKPGGVTQISLLFLDGRVSSMSVAYNGPAWSHVDRAVENFVAGKNLPPVNQWSAYVGMDNQLKLLTCSEFEIRVFAGGPGGNLNYVLVKDLEAEKKLRDRQAKAQAAETPTP